MDVISVVTVVCTGIVIANLIINRIKLHIIYKQVIKTCRK